MKQLPPTQRAALTILADQPQYAANVAHLTKGKVSARTAVYPVLSALRRKGFVTSKVKGYVTYFHITSTGRKALKK